MTISRFAIWTVLACASAMVTVAQEAMPLLKPAREAGARQAGPRRPERGVEEVRQRLVEVDQGALRDTVEGKRRIAIDLFDDVRVVAEELAPSPSGSGETLTWMGRVLGMERGHVAVAVTGEMVSANVSTDDGRFYWIRQVEGRLHEVREVRPVEREQRDDAVVARVDPEAAAKASPERLATRARGATSFIDILVAYTTAAKNAAGGASAIQNKIQLAITETNMAYLNSNVEILLHLVGTTEVDYNEGFGIERALDDLQGTSDGFMDSIHTQRNSLGADLVALLIADQGETTAGLGFLMQTVNSSFAPWAFSVSVQDFVTGPNYTFAHEVGHNMGDAHDRANASNQGAYPYSYGFQNLTGGTFFRTIMAYSCSGVNCPKINYFSNPLVNYQGSATGVNSAAANAADNAQSMNNTAPVIAAFRAAAGACTYTLSPTSASPAAGGGSGSFTVTAPVGCVWNAATTFGWIQLTGSTSGSGNGTVNYSVQSNGGSARSGSITAGGQTFTINQGAAGGCSYSLNPTSASHTPGGGSGSVTVTTGSSCAWTATTGDNWIQLTGGTSGTGGGSVSYSVAANIGGARNGSISIGGVSFGISQSANPGVTFTVTSNPAGLTVTVDGTAYTTPQTFNWTAGSSHTLSASTQGSGTRHLFLNWSDGGAATHSITAPASSTTYTASFQKQYLLTSGASPANGGSLALVPAAADGYYNSGVQVQATATPAAGYTFTGWSGALLGALNPATVTMDAAKSLTAGFTASSGGVTITSNPVGRTVIVDGVSITTPQVFQWAMGSQHTLDTVAFQTGAGSKHTFSSWSDGGPQSHPITIFPGMTVFTANFSTTYQLTATALPQGGGIVTPSPVSGDGYYAAGSTVQLAAAPLQGFQFVNWTGDLGGTNANTSVLMAAPRTVTANFTAATVCSFSLNQTAAAVLATGDLRSVQVAAGASCAWSATSNAAWITILSGTPGTGSGAVRYSVEPNPNNAPRSGSMTIAGVSYTVTQAAAGCTFTLAINASLLALPYHSSGYPVTITTQAGCAWTGTASPSWISLSQSAGTGSGTVNMVLSENTGGAPRLGSISVGGQHLQILQQSPSMGVLFSDVPASHMFFDHIGLIRLNNITPGCGTGTYCPESPMLRTEMAAFIIRAMFGENFTYSPNPYFTDVPANHAYFKYVQKLRETGITVGCTNTTYCPNDPVTRGQMAAFLIRARLGVTQGTPFPHALTPYFTDVPVTDVFFPYVQKMKELGITSGCQLTVYCNTDPNTRGQMAAFINRALLQ